MKARPGNKMGKNGQLEFWKFILGLLTDKNYRDTIEWIGNSGQFKLLKPERVATLWGETKGNKSMNLCKMRRIFTNYHNENSMIRKISTSLSEYKFICNLKELTGYSAKQLSDIVNGVPRQPKARRFA